MRILSSDDCTVYWYTIFYYIISRIQYYDDNNTVPWCWFNSQLIAPLKLNSCIHVAIVWLNNFCRLIFSYGRVIIIIKRKRHDLQDKMKFKPVDSWSLITLLFMYWFILIFIHHITIFVQLWHKSICHYHYFNIKFDGDNILIARNLKSTVILQSLDGFVHNSHNFKIIQSDTSYACNMNSRYLW